jgi:hypothetical protein
VLRSLSPEQLDVLAERARRLRKRDATLAGDPTTAGNEKPLDTVLRVYAPDPESLRAGAEAVLATHTKAWRFSGVVAGQNGERALEYRVRLRRKVPSSVLQWQLRERFGSAAARVELS